LSINEETMLPSKGFCMYRSVVLVVVFVSTYAAQLNAFSFFMMEKSFISRKLYMKDSGVDDDVAFQQAQEALVSPRKARAIRKSRSFRGHISSKIAHDEGSRVQFFTLKRERFSNFKRHKAHTANITSIQMSIRRRCGVDLPYESTIKALRTYHSLHGDLAMPRRFIVPGDSGFPNEWVGLDLAASVYTMKWWKKIVRIDETNRVCELNALGFVWERLQPEWNIVLQALITFHALYGHVLVANKFVVPRGSDLWPKATWGIPLGNCVYRIRGRNDFLHGSTANARRSQLDSLDFVWDVHEHQFLKFFAVLRHYSKLTGTGKFSPDGQIKPLRISSNYFVPDNDKRWPKELWNYQLGAKCTAIRQKRLYVKNKPKRQRMLEDLGFRWCGNAELAWLKVVHSAAIFSKLHERNLDVPYKFVVPPPPAEFIVSGEEWPWPEYLWGLPLGQRLKDIRTTGAYLKGKDKDARCRQLEALGFIWDVREHRRRLKKSDVAISLNCCPMYDNLAKEYTSLEADK
jgi:hypothetical protein